MGAMKEIAARGAYFIEIGVSDLDVWSQLMINDLGNNVKPFLNEVRQWSLIIVQKKEGAQSTKINCWDFQGCDKHITSEHENELRSCPAFLETQLNGINGGKNGGRACWVIPDTLCFVRIRRTLIPKHLSCMLCNFKKNVLKEEKSDLTISDSFLNMLIH